MHFHAVRRRGSGFATGCGGWYLPLGFSEWPGWTGGEAFGLNPAFFLLHFHYIIASALGYCAHADSSISAWKVDASEASGLNGSPGIQEWYGAHMILKKSTTPLLERWPCRSTSWHQGGCRLGGASAHCYRGAQDVLCFKDVLMFDNWTSWNSKHHRSPERLSLKLYSLYMPVYI